ncbi:MAG: DUF1624 domain-containing protein [Ruminococcaceae bacterium]|nr:DUF1624 domain-containing protein [Oscillospiraceae bacterium]
MTSVKTKNRIWELDFLRGICIWGVVFVHFIFDIQVFTNIKISTSTFFDITMEYGGIIFILLSGICVTLGRKSIKRGLIVFIAGILISIVTFLLFQSTTAMVWFGILHFLGICMILSPLLKKCPQWLLPILSICSVLLGYLFETITVSVKWLFPLGLTTSNFGSGDYFPMFPNIGFFIIGIFLGRLLYKNKRTLFPRVNTSNILVKFFCFCGRHSLFIYLCHQPIAYIIVMSFLA